MRNPRCLPQTHDEARDDDAIWLTWRLVGWQSVPAGDEPGEDAYRLELRDCPKCGTTKSRAYYLDGRRFLDMEHA